MTNLINYNDKYNHWPDYGYVDVDITSSIFEDTELIIDLCFKHRDGESYSTDIVVSLKNGIPYCNRAGYLRFDKSDEINNCHYFSGIIIFSDWGKPHTIDGDVEVIDKIEKVLVNNCKMKNFYKI